MFDFVTSGGSRDIYLIIDHIPDEKESIFAGQAGCGMDFDRSATGWRDTIADHDPPDVWLLPEPGRKGMHDANLIFIFIGSLMMILVKK